MAKEAVEATTSLDKVEKLAHALWAGWYGYECPNCRYGVYGKSEEWCHAHLLEHVVDKLRKEEKLK